jgi:hypothetical protein
MTTYRLDKDEPKLPAAAQALDVVIYEDDAYRLYEDPQRGLRMFYLGDAQAYLAQEHEARRRELADLDATQDAAANRWGY